MNVYYLQKSETSHPLKKKQEVMVLYSQVLRAESSTKSEEMSSSTPASFLAMQV